MSFRRFIDNHDLNTFARSLMFTAPVTVIVFLWFSTPTPYSSIAAVWITAALGAYCHGHHSLVRYRNANPDKERTL